MTDCVLTIAGKCALSDPTDKDFGIKCGHYHSLICENCNKAKSEDLLHDFDQAQDSILKWKAILRSVYQEQVKQHVLDDLDSSSVLIVADWAMKFLQRRYREKQSDWYRK